MLEVGPTLDCGSCAVLKILLYRFQERCSDLNVHAVFKSNLVRRVSKFGVVFKNLSDLFSEARVLAQLIFYCGLWSFEFGKRRCARNLVGGRGRGKGEAAAATRNSDFAGCRGNREAELTI